MPADKDCIFDPSENTYHICSAHHQFEVNLVSWRLEVSEIELTYYDTKNVIIIDGQNLPCYFADGFCKPTTKTPFTLVWFSDDFCLILTLQDSTGRMAKVEDRRRIEPDSFAHFVAFKCEDSVKKKIKNCFQGSVDYRRVDRTVCDHNAKPLPVTLLPLGCKNNT